MPPDYDRNDGRPGVVYILRNEAFAQDIYKIGQSTRSGIARARDLNRTVGTETPKLFICVFEMRTLDCGRAEKAVFSRLSQCRLGPQEYFRVGLEQAIEAIKDECARIDAELLQRLNEAARVTPAPPSPPVSATPPRVLPAPTAPVGIRIQPRRSIGAYAVVALFSILMVIVGGSIGFWVGIFLSWVPGLLPYGLQPAFGEWNVAFSAVGAIIGLLKAVREIRGIL